MHGGADMAKTTGALMSMVASGKFASSIVFDKRGRARAYVIPANPQSTGQGDVRQKLAACQAVLKQLIAGAITAVKAVAPVPSQWNSYAVQQCIGTGSGYWTAAANAWTALAGGDHTAWDAAFPTVVVPDISYKAMTDLTAGEAAFHVAYGLYQSGAITAPGTPGAANSAAWATALLP
jgi:hypothetical protein